MYYVYVLISKKDGKFYTGYTSDLKLRVSQHRQGKVFSTKLRLPVKLVYYEAYTNSMDAQRREKYLKTTMGKRDLRVRLRDGLTYEGLIG